MTQYEQFRFLFIFVGYENQSAPLDHCSEAGAKQRSRGQTIKWKLVVISATFLTPHTPEWEGVTKVLTRSRWDLAPYTTKKIKQWRTEN